MPIYWRNDENEVYLVSDLAVPAKNNKLFEAGAEKFDLWRGGAVVFVRTSAGVVAVYDDRYKWYKPFAGIALAEEGSDLTRTGRREVMEEAFIFRVDRSTRIVPIGTKEAALKNCLDVSVQGLEEVGEVKYIAYDLNEKNRALEAVLEWDTSSVEIGKISITLEEDWWQGAHSGGDVFVLGNGGLVGLFSGQQGFITLGDVGKHPMIQKYLPV